jgi:hypothetical protein
MNEQLLITWLLIAVAAGYLLFRCLRTWRGLRGGGCSGGCACSRAKPASGASKGTLIPLEQLTLRKRPTEPES